ncbi:MAG TPA: 1,2-phenylacetyl-CoA epoxidase subunit PaaC [Ilumatobacter sp.]|nr:1,2-phenylacetyl-CoA epoxidase subunit PaaC [Ilumatobacter sp.]
MKSPTCDRYAHRQADRALILAQRLLETITHSPEIEEDMALSNLALDLIGQARTLYTYVDPADDGEDRLAYFRDAHEFLNPLLVEQPNGDFAGILVRQFLHDAFAVAYWDAMTTSTDATFAALAGKAVKETTYHLRHSRSWVIRLGDGTDESHRRVAAAVERLWPFTHELFEVDEVERELVATGIAVDPADLLPIWQETVHATLAEATLAVPTDGDRPSGGRVGLHSPEFDALIAELQVVARAHPGATW